MAIVADSHLTTNGFGPDTLFNKYISSLQSEKQVYINTGFFFIDVLTLTIALGCVTEY